MDKLFLSKRMFIDNEFLNGGILVTPSGKIRSILRSQQEINSWMYANEADEVCLPCFFSCLINNYLKVFEHVIFVQLNGSMIKISFTIV